MWLLAWPRCAGKASAYSWLGNAGGTAQRISEPRAIRLSNFGLRGCDLRPCLHHRFGCALALCLLNPDGICSYSVTSPRPHCAPTTPKQHGRPTPAPTAWSDDTCKSIFPSHWPPLARTRDDRLSAFGRGYRKKLGEPYEARDQTSAFIGEACRDEPRM